MGRHTATIQISLEVWPEALGILLAMFTIMLIKLLSYIALPAVGVSETLLFVASS
jgi:hypothetical protein